MGDKMGMSDGYAGEIDPKAAWALLQQDPAAILVDVRTAPEWSYVGLPDLGGLGRQPAKIAWQVYPAMEVNPGFAEQVAAAGAGPDTPLLFLCRSGVRSLAAARLMTAQGYSRCYNVTGGFEGPHDADRHRGTVAGWKQAGLPWTQG